MASLWMAAFLFACYAVSGTDADCQDDQLVEGMTRSSEDITQGAVVIYNCETGYKPNGLSGEITCQNNDTWTPLLLNCTIHECGAPPDKSGDHMVPADSAVLFFGDTVTYSCVTGYDPDGGSGNMTCGASSFDTVALTCTIHECGAPPDKSGNHMVPGDSAVLFYGQTVTYSCVTGYDPDAGSGDMTCGASGFGNVALTCTIHECGAPPDKSADHMVPGDSAVLFFGDTVTYSCVTGYDPDGGSGNMTCGASGFDTVALTCTIHECGAPPDKSADHMVPGDSAVLFFGDTVTYSCVTGYDPDGGSGDMTCGASGFDTVALTCTIVSCDEPPSKTEQHMTASNSASLDYEGTVTYTCENGYSHNGESGVMTCGADGSFDDIPLVCTKTLDLVGSYGLYAGETKLICTLNDDTVTDAVTWQKGSIAITDGADYKVGTAVGNTFTLTIEDTQFEDLGEYTCSNNTQMGTFTLTASDIQALDVTTVVGKSTITLEINHVLPQSLVISVTYNDEVKQGTLDPDPMALNDNSLTYTTNWTNDNRLLKGTYMYTVTNGANMTKDGLLEVTECEDFYYDDCSKKCICNQTLSVSCDDGTGLCTCESGWTGANCEQDIDECLDTNICPEANDHCVNSDASYTCVCNTGYHTVNDECTQCTAFTYGENCSSNCLCDDAHADSCDHISGDCSCKDGWRSPDCRQNIDECTEGNHNCGVNYRCIDNDGSFTCECDVGYIEDNNNCVRCGAKKYGENCAMDCICIQGNTQECNNIHGACDCKTGWAGADCSADHDECESGDDECNTTRPNSHCSNTHGSYECLCNDGFKTSGDTCQDCDATHWGTECSQLCDCTETNKGKCNPGNGSCSCDDGWQGANCMVNVDECQPDNPCGENGTCQDTNGGYTCTCNIGYSLTTRDTYGDKCTECNATHWGDACATECSCVVDNTMDCNNVDGTCSCKPGWQNTNCQTDVNECETKNGDCQEHTVCNNIDGSHECNCVAGYEKLANNTCAACDSTHYGVDCGNECTCNVDHTTDCDNANGACTCKNGWSGDNCTDDVNECTVTADICGVNAICSNTAGSYVCTCVNGWYKNSNNKCKDKAYKLSMKLDITEDISDATINARVKIEIKASLTRYFQSTVTDFLEIIIDGLRSGSVIADYRIITMDNVDSLSSLTGALQDALDGSSKIIYNDTQANVVEASMTTGEGTNAQTVSLQRNGDPCDTFLVFHQCEDNYECAVGNNGAECRLIIKKDNFELVVGLGVGIPVFLIALLLITLAVIYKNRHVRRKGYASSRESDSGDRTPPMAKDSRLAGHVNYFGRDFVDPYENRQGHRVDRHPPMNMSYYGGGPVGGTHWQSIGRVFDPNRKYEIRRPKYSKDPHSVYSHL